MTVQNAMKYACILFLLIIALGCAYITFNDLLVGRQPPTSVVTVLSLGIGYSLTALGIHQGAVTALSTPEDIKKE